MEQLLFKDYGLLKITDGGKSRLYRIPKNINDEPFEAQVIPFLPEPLTILDVYPEANLIVTNDTVFTLDGKIVLQHCKEKISVELVSDKWMLIQDSLQDNDTRFRITFWDGAQERDYIWGRKLLRSEKYFAVYTSGDRRWQVYQYDKTLVLDISSVDEDMNIHGDFLINYGIGCHAVYSLIAHSSAKSEQRCIFKQQQLLLCCSYDEFVLCANMQGMVKTYHRGQYRDFGKAEMAELYDHAGIFSLKRNGRFFLYHLDGEPFAQNICPYGADSIAYDSTANTLLIGTNGVFRLIRF